MIDAKVTLDDLLSKRKELKAFLFDLDGTLIDSQEGIIEIQKVFLKSKGHTIKEEEIRRSFGKPLEVIFGELLPEKTDEEILVYLNEIRKTYAENHLKITTVFPQVDELLQTINSLGYRMGIASTKFGKFILEATDHFNLTKYFEVIVSGYEVANHKPAPDIIFKSAELLGVQPENCVYIGDTPSDVQAGNSAGALTIAVLTGANDVEKMIPVKPDFIIKDLSSLQLKKDALL
ncbi:MAG: HAD family hydrolase [Candidatus Heimdallarchaeota archaeon]